METCEQCGKEFEDARKLQGHMMGAHKVGREDKEPEEDKVDPRRKDRVPFGVPQQRFGAQPKDGYHYRVFNDNWRKEPGRIRRALAAGYEKVPDNPINGMAVGSNDDGSAISGVLMRIPDEWYEADQKKKQAEIDKVDQQILKGKFQEGANDKRYIPSMGIKMETKLTP